MCNSLHKDAVKIPAEGVGYKLVKIYKKEVGLKGKMCSIRRDIFEAKKWYKWKEALYSESWCDKNELRKRAKTHGFCFFLTKKEALKLKKAWTCLPEYKTKVVKIQYRKGLGSHYEDNIVSDVLFKIALAKEFRIL